MNVLGGVVAAIGVGMLGACAGNGAAPRSLPVDVVFSSVNCGAAAAPGVRRIRDAAALRAITAADFQAEGDAVQRAFADPATAAASTLVQVDMGERPTAGYALSVERVDIVDGLATVHIAWTEPAPDAMVAQVVTHPCVVLRVAAPGVNRVRVVDMQGRERVPARVMD